MITFLRAPELLSEKFKIARYAVHTLTIPQQSGKKMLCSDFGSKK